MASIAQVSKEFGLSQDTLRYYERVGAVPPVHRTASGIRDYTEEDRGWVSLAKCMRSAGLPIEVMIEYLRLFQEGDSTFEARLVLLQDQLEALEDQKAAIESTIDRLKYKVAGYEKAVKTGKLEWDEPDPSLFEDSCPTK